MGGDAKSAPSKRAFCTLQFTNFPSSAAFRLHSVPTKWVFFLPVLRM